MLLREKYQGVTSPAYATDLERLHAGEPLAYIIGHIPFLSVNIYLDSRPLIPRSETEYWAGRVIETLLARTGTDDIRVLDLCAGSGCIGAAVLKGCPRARVDFAEKDEKHHETIMKNLRENGIDLARAGIFGGDLFERITGTYHVILTNPPYIDSALDRVDESVLAHEPHEALYGGTGGFELISRIIADARSHLAPCGVLYIEHEPEQVYQIRTCAHENGFSALVYPDQYGILRYSQLTVQESKKVAQ